MTGIILSSKLIESSLRAQFGEILPVELPLQNRALLAHQIRSLSEYCNKIFVTIPVNYEISLPSEVFSLEFDQNNSVIEIIKHVVDQFKIDEKVFINYGDSLFINIGPINLELNYFFVQRPIMQYNWGISDETGLVPAGGIVSTIAVLEDVLKESLDFNSFALKIQERRDVVIFKDFQWLDFGKPFTYYHSRKRFLESRSFNQLNYNKYGFLIKSSADILKMWSEFRWLKECKDKMPINVPYVKDFNVTKGGASYSIQYINHPPLSDIFVFGKLSEDYFMKILESVKTLIHKLKLQEFSDKPLVYSNLLVNKLQERRSSILEIATSLGYDSFYILKIIEDNEFYFSKKHDEVVPMHGDLCFSNILFDFSSFEPLFIDPRGYFSSEDGFSMYGPGSYDYYKLAHSYVMGYDYIIAGKEDDSFFTEERVLRRMTIFCDLFELNREDVKNGLINLFLTMIPLHSNSIKRQTAFLKIIPKIQNL